MPTFSPLPSKAQIDSSKSKFLFVRVGIQKCSTLDDNFVACQSFSDFQIKKSWPSFKRTTGLSRIASVDRAAGAHMRQTALTALEFVIKSRSENACRSWNATFGPIKC